VELNWSTFFLQIINFLVLVWILRRFLYKPVSTAIQTRKASIEKTLADAKAVRGEATTLQQQYENRLADWEREKQKARGQLLEEINAERTRRLAELSGAIDREREKTRALEQRRIAETTREAELRAIAGAARFASHLLSQLGGPELEARLIDMAMRELAGLSEEQLQSIRQGWTQADGTARVTSGYAIDEPRRNAIKAALSRLVGRELACSFDQDSSLISGLRVGLGPWVLRANLQDELELFSEAGRHTR